MGRRDEAVDVFRESGSIAKDDAAGGIERFGVGSRTETGPIRDDLVTADLRGVGTRLRGFFIASAMTLAAPALAQQKSTIERERPQVQGIVEPGSYLCDRSQGGGVSCRPTPLLPCGSPVPMRGGSETMAHSYCESLISDRVQDDPGRNIFPRRNSIVSCMTAWRRGNEVGHVASASSEDKQTKQDDLLAAENKGNIKEKKAQTVEANSNLTLLNSTVVQTPSIEGVSEAGSYFCDRSKGGAIACRPNPVLSCGTSKLLSIESEAMARQNCEELVPQRVQDDPGRNVFPRKIAIAGCLTRWRMSKKHLLMPGN
jgi:hypothetical protein